MLREHNGFLSFPRCVPVFEISKSMVWVDATLGPVKCVEFWIPCFPSSFLIIIGYHWSLPRPIYMTQVNRTTIAQILIQLTFFNYNSIQLVYHFLAAPQITGGACGSSLCSPWGIPKSHLDRSWMQSGVTVGSGHGLHVCMSGTRRGVMSAPILDV